MDELVSFLADQASTNLPDQVEALSRARKEHASATADVQASLAELEVNFFFFFFEVNWLI